MIADRMHVYACFLVLRIVVCLKAYLLLLYMTAVKSSGAPRLGLSCKAAFDNLFLKTQSNLASSQCCQPCSFLTNLGLFFCGVAVFCFDLRVACFWACLTLSQPG